MNNGQVSQISVNHSVIDVPVSSNNRLGQLYEAGLTRSLAYFGYYELTSYDVAGSIESLINSGIIKPNDYVRVLREIGSRSQTVPERHTVFYILRYEDKWPKLTKYIVRGSN